MFRQDRKPLQDGLRRFSDRLVQLVISSSDIRCRSAIRSPRPSASFGMRAGSAHASSSEESRLAVKSPIAAYMAAATDSRPPSGSH